MANDFNPLTALPPDEIPLPHAPLVRVIAQVRFPLVTSIEQSGFIAPFQEAIRAHYPILRSEQSHGVLVTPQGIAAAPSRMIWRFHDVEDVWRVALGPEFIALETKTYTSRHDFLQRLEVILDALQATIKPQVVDRLGLRYIDRIVDLESTDLVELLRPEMAGIATTVLGNYTQQALSETLFTLPGGTDRMLARWGLIPPHGTTDPTAIEPIDEPSWILDLDMFVLAQHSFDVPTLIGKARGFAERTYTFFRWAVTDTFLRRYGGQI